MSAQSCAPDDLPIPRALNVALTICALGLGVACLSWASRDIGLVWKGLAALAFSFINNTAFSLLHEAVHGTFHDGRRANDAFGTATAAFFPTSFTLQRFFHLGHHRRNRTPPERFDYIQPGENLWIKWGQWYGLLTGLYWLLPPLSCILFLAASLMKGRGVPHPPRSGWSAQTGAQAMLEGWESLPRARVAGEVLLAVGVHAGLMMSGLVTWQGWVLCYAAFAVNWSSLQYADHAWSPLDVIEGAWNLKVHPVIQAIFLNYHLHLAHHRAPSVPWCHLPALVQATDARPSFWSIYWRMWLGPRPLPDGVR